MVPDQLAALNKLIFTCTGNKKILFHVHYRQDGEAIAYFHGREALIDHLVELFTQCDIPARKHTQAHKSSDKQTRYTVIIPNIEALNQNMIDNASSLITKRQAIKSFRPETLQLMRHVLAEFSPTKLVKAAPYNRVYSRVLAGRQTHDFYLALQLAETELFPLFKSQRFEAMRVYDVVKLLKQIHKLAYKTVAEVRGFSDQLDTIPDEFKQLISLLLIRLARCSGEQTEVVKHAAYAYQQVTKISDYTSTNDLVATILLNAVLHAYGYPCIQLYTAAERQDETSLYTQAVKNIDSTSFYLEQQIDLKLELEHTSPSRIAEFSDKQKASIEAASQCRREKSDSRVEFARGAKRYHIGLLITHIRQLASQHVSQQLPTISKPSTFASYREEASSRYATQTDILEHAANHPIR